MNSYQDFIDQYEIIKSLGEGGFAEVKLGKEKSTGRLVAIKIIDSAKCSKDSFKKEFLIQRKFDSPYIVKIYSCYEDSANFIIVMEYIDGGELFDAIIENGPFTENDAAELIQQILIGLKVLHTNNVIHRDLKPSNILLSTNSETKETTIKICDFGLASIIKTEKIDDNFMGTVYYSAPEIIENRPYDSSVDIWSLGVVLYVLLSAYYPFESESIEGTKKNICQAKYDFNLDEWKEVSDKCRDFIQQMLQLDPHKRITIDDALKHPWLSGNAPKVQLGNLREHLRDFNIKMKFKGAVNSARAAMRIKKIALKL